MNVLQRAYRIITRELEAEDILDYLSSKNLLSERDCALISSKNARHCRTTTLLNLLIQKRKDNSVEVLMAALQDIKSFHLVREIQSIKDRMHSIDMNGKLCCNPICNNFARCRYYYNKDLFSMHT